MKLVTRTLLVCATTGLLLMNAYAQSANSGEAREIQMTAKKYEFKPKVVTVKQGERVKLIITATDRDHGIKCDAFKINQKLKKGDPATIEFTADKVGTFPFHCSDFCGVGHVRMKGKIVVEKP